MDDTRIQELERRVRELEQREAVYRSACELALSHVEAHKANPASRPTGCILALTQALKEPSVERTA